MDLYIADEDYNPRDLIDQYESLVWTERYSDAGDFVLTVKENPYFNYPKIPTFLISSVSNRVMRIETVQRKKQDDGPDLFELSGPSFESILKTRDNTSTGKVDDEYFLGSPDDIAGYIVFKYAIAAETAGEVNVIPKLSRAIIPQGLPIIDILLPRGNIFDQVKSLCDAFNLGFQIFRSDGNLIFVVYTGIDRTNPNDIANYRVYSPNTDTLLDVTSIKTVANWKNHARVIGAKTGVDVYAPDVDATVSGLDRRTLVIKQTDVGSPADEEDPEKQTTVADDQKILRVIGQRALADPANKYQSVIDGNIPQANWSSTSYGLGDIVMVSDGQGGMTRSIVTENIWTVDQNGEQHYPTFSAII